MYRLGNGVLHKSVVRAEFNINRMFIPSYNCGYNRLQSTKGNDCFDKDGGTALKDPEQSKNFHGRLLLWDEKLSVPPPPSLSSLLKFLNRRRVPSDASRVRKFLDDFVVRCATYVTGLWGASERINVDHGKDPIHSCWYAPANQGDTFGIRHDEIYFHPNIIPSQPVTSYAVVIRGSPQYPGSAVKGGIAENDIESEIMNNHVVGDEVMIGRAASLVLGLLKTREFYLSQDFKREFIKKTPLSMQWYSYIFSCSMQFYPGCIERYRAPAISSRHVIVMHNGDMYKMDVLLKNDRGEETTISLSQLKRQFQRILKAQLTNRRTSLPTGVLTSLTPAERSQEEQKLKALSEKNVENLSTVRDALFVVCLENGDSPRSANEAMYALQSKNFVNRWYDKSVQLVVFRNGVAGFVNNYLAGMTGTVGTNFIRMAVGSEGDFKDKSTASDADDSDLLSEPLALSWDDTTDQYFQRRLQEFIHDGQTSGPFKPISQDVSKICQGFSFVALCRDHGVTPGGTFQAALQLALARVCDGSTSVGEVVSIRHLRFGGMTFMEASMADMKAFVSSAQPFLNLTSLTNERREILRKLLIRAIHGYREEVLHYKNGDMYSWHLDSLYRKLGLPNRLPFRETLPPDLKTRLRGAAICAMRNPLVNIFPPMVPENVTSNPDWYPQIEAIGRTGVKCILPPGSMALHYIFGKRGISITINADPKHPCYKKEEALASELETNLKFVLDLLITDRQTKVAMKK